MPSKHYWKIVCFSRRWYGKGNEFCNHSNNKNIENESYFLTLRDEDKGKNEREKLTLSLARRECFWTTFEKPEAFESAILCTIVESRKGNQQETVQKEGFLTWRGVYKRRESVKEKMKSKTAFKFGNLICAFFATILFAKHK